MTFSSKELDALHYERVVAIEAKVHDGDFSAVNSLFASERVDAETAQEKVLLHSFNVDQVLSYLPFSPRIYVSICPYCVSDQNKTEFITLVKAGAIIPTLSAPYRAYSDEIVETTVTHDHISYYELQLYRGLFAGQGTKTRICPHCVGKRESSIKRMLSRRPELGYETKHLERVVENLHPYVNPDYQLLDELSEAVKKNDSLMIWGIHELSDVVHKVRTCEVFKSPLVIDSADYRELPRGVSSSIDEAIDHSRSMEKRIVDGLGLHIARDVPLEKYIEIASDYRPRISAIIESVGGPGGEQSPLNLQREIMKINGEVEKISRSGRYIALEACIDFYKRNNVILNAALAAGALGMTNGLAGCLGGGGAGALASLARRKRWVSAGQAGERFSRVVQNSIQPTLDALVAKYVNSSSTAVSVLSLRKQLSVTGKG